MLNVPIYIKLVFKVSTAKSFTVGSKTHDNKTILFFIETGKEQYIL